jgi:hypothetical protein
MSSEKLYLPKSLLNVIEKMAPMLGNPLKLKTMQ